MTVPWHVQRPHELCTVSRMEALGEALTDLPRMFVASFIIAVLAGCGHQYG
jgi:hypothetical protein